MGYQNQDRPDNLDLLLIDLDFDLNDLKHDVIGKSDRASLVEAIEFIRETQRIINVKYRNGLIYKLRTGLKRLLIHFRNILESIANS